MNPGLILSAANSQADTRVIVHIHIIEDINYSIYQM